MTPGGRWIEFQRLNTSYRYPTSGGITCSTRSILQWARNAAGLWNYTFPGSDACTYTRVNGVVSMSPDGASERFQGSQHVDQQGRATSYLVGVVNSIFGPIELEVEIAKPEGNTFDFSRDERNNLTRTTATSKAGTETLSASAFFGPTSACTATTTKICNQPEYTVDANGNRTDYEYYPEHGSVRYKTLPPDADGVRAVLTYSYEQKSARYKNGPSIFVNGTPVWKLTKVSRCKMNTSCAGTIDEVVVTYGYDENLRLTTETIQDGTGAVFSSVTKTYDPVGNLVEVDGPLPGTVDKVYSFYDEARQKIGEIGIDPDGAGPLPRPATRTSYDNDGKPTYVYTGTASGTTVDHLHAMSIARYVHTKYDDGLGHPGRETIVAGGVTQRITQYKHDFRGKLVCTAVRMNPTVYGSLPADACAPSAAGGHGPDRITRNIYNSAGELVQVIQGIGTPLRRAYATYKYIDNGLMEDWVDANGNRTHLTYDGFDRLDTTYFPSANRTFAFNPATPESALSTASAYNSGDYEKFEYYPGGNRRTWRRRDGAVISYGYDGLNRQTSRDLPGGSDLDVYTNYDLLGNVTSRRFASRTGIGVSYITDVMGRVRSTTDMNGRTLGYGYNEASGRKRLTYPDGNYIGYQLDYANRPTDAGWNSLTGLYSQSYDGLGRISTMSKGAGATGFEYHYSGAIARMVNDFAGTAHDIAWTFPTHNPVGQVVTQNSSSDLYDYVDSAVLTTTKSYDGLNRDAAIAALPNGYDARGNLRNDGTRSFTYDIENKLVTASGGSASLALTYDPEGRIAKYRSGASEISFVYDGNDLVAEYASDGAMLRRYLHGAGTDDPILWLEGRARATGAIYT